MQKKDVTTAGVSKGSQAQSPTTKSRPQFISPLKSPLGASGKPNYPTRQSFQTRTYTSAAAARSHSPLSGGTTAAIVATSVGESVSSKCLERLECRDESLASGLTGAESRSRQNNKTARSLVYKSGRATEEGKGGMRSRSPSRSLASRLVTPAGGTFPSIMLDKEKERTADSSEDFIAMEEEINLTAYSALPQRTRSDATTKMATVDTYSNDHATTKMSATTCLTTSTNKMAAATSETTDASTKMTSTSFKTMTYKPNVPLELAEDLPPSAGMIIQLIQNLRIDLKK
ncbi:Hypothetical predicted protein [Pelobates cultripes]|uniref:Uncharacterized protein n=1 Tax=Pelobates cultripes TaxID=61616 RepID=A0AAD1RQH0_PELCU|nr:Hypothetical predicted protein [Pelobates cultripes]